MEYDVPYTAAQIMTFLGLKSKDIFRKLYLNPALERNLIAMKLLDKPISRNQSYINYCTFMPPYKAAFSHNTSFFPETPVSIDYCFFQTKKQAKPRLAFFIPYFQSIRYTTQEFAARFRAADRAADRCRSPRPCRASFRKFCPAPETHWSYRRARWTPS